ncbi:MAG: glycoside hydrolase family 55 protein, partial [Cytophagales bacterium]|nr:glycoside hydrolase family 55 protein [Cytophagales bacterium]
MKANQAISSLFIAVVFVSCASPGKAQADEGILEQLDLVDYSYAGYDFGESELPTGYDLPVFNVEDFGAVANDDISDQEAIEKAIDRAEMKGGVVLFGAGKYIVNDTKGNKNGILIKSSNVILKGTGSGENGTI